LQATVTRPSPDNGPNAGTTAPSRDACVLLVEDDQEVATAMVALIESFGWCVVHAGSAEAALELLEAGRPVPDVVLTDISMPGEYDGMELAIHLRDTRPTLRVVLITGYVSKVHRAAWQGFELLPKPCPPAMLAAALAGSR